MISEASRHSLPREDFNRAYPMLSRRFEEAFLFACKMHGGQTKKGGDIPYISHLMAVAGLVLEAGGDEDLAIAALLHDVVEDCGGAPVLVDLARRFGERVAHIVDGCTDAYTDFKPPWRERKEQYLRRLSQADNDVRLVSTADKLHNGRSILLDYRQIGESLWQRFHGGREGTLWYYRALLDEFKQGTPNGLTSEFERVVLDVERLTQTASNRR